MTQQRIDTDAAAAPIGPYSPAVSWNGLVFVSGQGPINSLGKVVGDTLAAQVEQALANVDALLQAAGSGRDCVLKAQVYLADLEQFDEFNRIYEKFFRGCILPARTTIQAAALPGGIDVELDVVAFQRSA